MTEDTTPTDERAAFEAWAKQHGRIFLDLKAPGLVDFGPMYANPFTQEAWVGWQARASLAPSSAAGEAIKHPERCTDCEWPPELPCPTCNAPAIPAPPAPSQPAPSQAVPLTDEQIEADFQRAGGRWNGNCWSIEDADLHPYVRGITGEPKHG